MLKHPLFSEDMEDKFSTFLLAYSKSMSGLVFGFISLVAVIAVMFLSVERGGLLIKFLIAFSLTGILLTWLAAQARAYSQKKRKWMVAIFFIWPLSYWFLFSEKYREFS